MKLQACIGQLFVKTASPPNGKYNIICITRSNAYCDAYFIVWPQFVTQIIYVLGGPFMTT